MELAKFSKITVLIFTLLPICINNSHCAEPDQFKKAKNRKANLNKKQNDTNSSLPRDYRLSLKFNKTKYFLGENVIAKYIVENTGKTPLKIYCGGDRSGPYIATRFKVTALVDNTNFAPCSYSSVNPIACSGPSNMYELKTGEKFIASIPLAKYVRFLKPGNYKISISHDLGWSSRFQNTEKLLTAESNIEFIMPTKEEAQQVIDSMSKLPQEWSGIYSNHAVEFCDFSTFTYPIYLDLLIERLHNKSGSRIEDTLLGIGSIPTIQATKALIKFARDTKNTEYFTFAAKQLIRRLPPSTNMMLSQSTGNLYCRNEERIELANRAWNEQLAPELNLIAKEYISSADKEAQITAAEIMQSIGDKQSLKELSRVLNVAILESKSIPASLSDSEAMAYYYPSPRGNIVNLMKAAKTFATRNNVTTHPIAPSDKALFMLVIHSDSNFRPPGWQQEYAKFCKSDIPFIRQLALETCPEIVPPEVVTNLSQLLKDHDLDVKIATVKLISKLKEKKMFEKELLNILATTNIFPLFESTCDTLNGLDKSKILLTLAKRLGEEPLSTEIMLRLLQLTVDAFGYGNRSGVAIEANETAQIKAVRSEWLKFISNNNMFFSKGGKLKIGDPRLKPSLFPAHWCVQNKDWTEWPPR